MGTNTGRAKAYDQFVRPKSISNDIKFQKMKELQQPNFWCIMFHKASISAREEFLLHEK